MVLQFLQMLPRDKVSKAAWGLTISSSDATDSMLVQATRDGKLKLDREQLQVLRDLIKESIQIGYNRSYNVFMKEVDLAIEDVVDKTISERQEAVEPISTKKN